MFTTLGEKSLSNCTLGSDSRFGGSRESPAPRALDSVRVAIGTRAASAARGLRAKAADLSSSNPVSGAGPDAPSPQQRRCQSALRASAPREARSDDVTPPRRLSDVTPARRRAPPTCRCESGWASSQVGASVAPKHLVVSECGRGRLAAAPSVFPGNPSEVLLSHLALSELSGGHRSENQTNSVPSRRPLTPAGAFLVESIMPPTSPKMLVEFPDCFCQRVSVAGHLLFQTGACKMSKQSFRLWL